MTELKIVSSEQTNKHFCDWLANKTGNEFVLDPSVPRTLAHVETEDGKTFNDDQILVVCAYHNWLSASCEVTHASNGAKKQKASREFVWHCLNYAFNAAGKQRINAHIAIDNHKSQVLMDMLGFTKLCLIKDFYGKDKDAYFFGLTKREWLAGPWAHLFKQ